MVDPLRVSHMAQMLDPRHPNYAPLLQQAQDAARKAAQHKAEVEATLKGADAILELAKTGGGGGGGGGSGAGASGAVGSGAKQRKERRPKQVEYVKQLLC